MMNRTTEDILDEYIRKHIGEWVSSREAAWYAKCTTRKAAQYILEHYPNVERGFHQRGGERFSIFRININHMEINE